MSNGYGIFGTQTQWPAGSSGEPTGGPDKPAEAVATLGSGEVQAPEAPVWPMFLVSRLKSKVFITPSELKSILAF